MRAMSPDELEPGGQNAPLHELAGPPPALPEGALRLRWHPRADAPLDMLVVNKGSNDLVVSLHGALDRARTTLPRFERLRMLHDFPVSAVYVGDPTLHLGDDLQLAWYTGWEGYRAHEDIAQRLAQVAEAVGAKRIIVTGSSGGGFAALQISSYLPGSVAVAFNAQTDIRNYKADGVHYFSQRFYVRYVWPKIWDALEPPEMVEIGTWDRTLDDRTSALQRYAKPIDNLVHMIQNEDEFHHEDHFLPFLRVARAAGNTVLSTTVHEGPKHVVPSPEVFRSTISRVLELEAAPA